MLTRCVSCGAPAPSNRSDFFFLCEFCGTKNVEQEYLKERAKSAELKTKNKFFDSALLAIESADFEKATTLIESALNEDSQNQEILIYQAYCHAALVKPSNFEKNFRVAETALTRAKGLGEGESFQLGRNQVANMFLEKSYMAAQYYYDTAKKKLLAFGDNEGTRLSMSVETGKGLELLLRTITFGPTDTDLIVKTIISGLDEIYEVERSAKLSTDLQNQRGEFLTKLFEFFEKYRETVETALKKSPNGSSILEILISMGAPTSSAPVNNVKTSSKGFPTWVLIALSIALLLILVTIFGGKSDKQTTPKPAESKSEPAPSTSDSSKLVGLPPDELIAKLSTLSSKAFENIDREMRTRYALSLSVGTPSKRDDDWVVAEGCMPRNCNNENGIVIYSQSRTELIVFHYNRDNGKNNLVIMTSYDSSGFREVAGGYRFDRKLPTTALVWLKERGFNMIY